ncbi:hypothetical protein QOZ80_7BG0587420 [Eleusine coracana subsp. coracana]|nr:hypothetical protein QOZ80_7BG0587420 [Eleusine coracana subsp. coracana]
MDPASAAATASLASAWRRSLAGAPAAEDREALVRRRADEMEAAVAALRAGKEAAERAAAALRAELESERAAAETAASEAMAMIARLQREKSAAMIEAREFRRIAEGRAGHDREVQDRLAGARALAASYRERLRAHGVDPDGDGDGDEEKADPREDDGRVEAGVSGDDINYDGDVEAEEQLKYAVVAVRCAAVATNAAAAEEQAVDENLCARVEALEANSAAVRREVAALRVERAKVALARRLRRDAAAARAIAVAANKRRFSVLAVFKWLFSTVLRGTKRSASTARSIKLTKIYRGLPNPASWAPIYFLFFLLPLLVRLKGVLRIRSKTGGNGVPRPRYDGHL